MSSIVVAGDTSGTVTLQAPSVAGSTVLNLPTISGGTMYTSTAAGDLYLGTTDTSGVGGQLDKLRVIGTTGPNSSIAQFRYTADNGSPNLRQYKSRGTSVGSFTALQTGDFIGTWQSYGSDGTSWATNSTATIQTFVDGTVSTGIIPGGILFAVQSTSGTLPAQASIRANGDMQFNSGYGTYATAYGCRAWVSFNGASGASPVIRGSGNVTSVTRTGTGAYTVALTTAMPDTNYAITAIGSTDTAGTGRFFGAYPNSTSSILVASNQSTGTALDVTIASIAIFR